MTTRLSVSSPARFCFEAAWSRSRNARWFRTPVSPAWRGAVGEDGGRVGVAHGHERSLSAHRRSRTARPSRRRGRPSHLHLGLGRSAGQPGRAARGRRDPRRPSGHSARLASRTSPSHTTSTPSGSSSSAAVAAEWVSSEGATTPASARRLRLTPEKPGKPLRAAARGSAAPAPVGAEREGASNAASGVVPRPGATEELGPGRVVVAVGVKGGGCRGGQGPRPWATSNCAIATARLSSTTGDPVCAWRASP